MIHLLQLDHRVPPGLYGEYLRDAGHLHRTVRLFAGDDLPVVVRGDGIVVFGGYMGVGDEADYPFLAPLKDDLRGSLDNGTPIMGLCLGGQLLAEVLGGRVRSDSRGEKGLREIALTAAGRQDPLFAGLPDRFDMFQWHNDSFDPPPDAVPLAGSAICPGQAFRFGNAIGLQFHPEVDADIVRRWCSPIDSSGCILEEFRGIEAVHGRLATRMLANFLAK